MINMAHTPENGHPSIRLSTPTPAASRAFEKALRGDAVITSDGRTYRVDRVRTVAGERRIYLIDGQGAVTVVSMPNRDRRISGVAVVGTVVMASPTQKSSKSKVRRDKARESSRRRKAARNRSIPDPSEVSVSVRAVSGGLPGLGKRH